MAPDCVYVWLQIAIFIIGTPLTFELELELELFYFT